MALGLAYGRPCGGGRPVKQNYPPRSQRLSLVASEGEGPNRIGDGANHPHHRRNRSLP